MSDSPDTRPAIEFRNVSYRLHGNGDAARVLLHDLNLEVQRGETLVLLGRSGSGKTTTLKLINRLLTPSKGELLVDSRPIHEWDVIRLRRMIGYVIQDVGLFPHFTVERNIGLVPKIEQWHHIEFPSESASCCSLSGSILRSPRVIRANFPEASASEWAWHALLPRIRPSF